MMIKKICLCLYSVWTIFQSREKRPLVSLCLSACPLMSIGQIWVYVGNFHENLSQNYIVRLKSDRMWETSLEDVSRFILLTATYWPNVIQKATYSCVLFLKPTVFSLRYELNDCI